MRKKVCVVTGSRAEYGLLRPLLKKIKKDEALKLQLVVTGAHLAREFGLTYKEIERDGFRIDSKINILSGFDTPVDTSKSMARAIYGFATAYEKIRPDVVVVLGDRFEIFSAATAAHVAGIPVAHIYGGELTEGAIDDAFRHSITKLSQLHFTATAEYRRRVIQLGEDPRRVFCAGSLGIDSLRSLKLLSKYEFQKWAGIRLNKHNLLITFHPVTLEGNRSAAQFEKLLRVLDELKDTTLIFTKANADTFGRVINAMIDNYVAHNRAKTKAFTSMGQLGYFSAMKHVDAIVGNSSSGIIEAPSFRKGTINIGLRQAGRTRSKSVIDCLPEEKSIRDAFDKLYSLRFKRILRSVINPYRGDNAAEKIIKVLKQTDFKNILIKSFYDVPFNMKNR